MAGDEYANSCIFVVFFVVVKKRRERGWMLLWVRRREKSAVLLRDITCRVVVLLARSLAVVRTCIVEDEDAGKIFIRKLRIYGRKIGALWQNTRLDGVVCNGVDPSRLQKKALHLLRNEVFEDGAKDGRAENSRVEFVRQGHELPAHRIACHAQAAAWVVRRRTGNLPIVKCKNRSDALASGQHVQHLVVARCG